MPGELTLFTCPECGGPLGTSPGTPRHYRCVVGHAFGGGSLDAAMRRKTEESLWAAVRLLQQRANLARQHGERQEAHERSAGARVYQSRSEEASSQARVLRELLTRIAAGDPREDQLG